LELVIQDDPKVLPGLILRMAIGSHYDDLVLDGATVGQSGTEVFFKLKLKKVFVSAVNLSGTDGDRAVYNVALEWGAMQMTTWKRLPNGTLEQAAESSWSRVLNNNSFSVTP
jgi:type VI protein secretion system component Hcp